ncbi:MAG: polyprenyl synthetase family protein [Candidatus Omnitrophica bacterium]|nr:polyprenyl synthetase family protein [Candidatus Omnitrophota bacterium]
MLNKIKNRIEKEIPCFMSFLNKTYGLEDLSPLLFSRIKEFVSRSGKRIRPSLFVAGYLGYKHKPAPFLFRSALSIELLHDFMLVHDDIIDKSDLRRGKPSMHSMFNKDLEKFDDVKFNGQDLAIVAGDIMYAMGLKGFLEVRENPVQKEASLKKIIDAAVYTGNGEFIELLLGNKDIDKVTEEDITKVYDYKTAFYTFACPLSAGALLAGAGKKQTDNLFRFGMALGRGFQIKDDILGLYGDEKIIGKSTLTDLQEAKKTILIWYAYNHAKKIHTKIIRSIMNKTRVTTTDVNTIRAIICESGALEYAKAEVNTLLKKTRTLLFKTDMAPEYKNAIYHYSEKILSM